MAQGRAKDPEPIEALEKLKNDATSLDIQAKENKGHETKNFRVSKPSDFMKMTARLIRL